MPFAVYFIKLPTLNKAR